MHNFEAGISYPGTAYKVGLKVEDNGNKDYSGSAYVLWGLEDTDQIKAEYAFRKGNLLSLDYLVSVHLQAFDWDKIAISGTLDHNPQNSQLKLNWSHGMKVYKLELEHSAIEDGLESGIHALLKMNEVEYRGVVIYRLDEVMKAVKIDLYAEKHLSLVLKVKKKGGQPLHPRRLAQDCVFYFPDRQRLRGCKV